MPLDHILILGAGPAGLSAALSLAQMSRSKSTPLRITVLELRPVPTTLGGTINLTPLGLRYVDRLGVGNRLRPQGIRVRGIDMVSLRTGSRLGSLWEGVDAMRIRRSSLVDSLLETCRDAENRDIIEIRFGVRVTAISEKGKPEDADGKVVLQTADGETIEGDILVGADGIHSVARSLYVEPDRVPVYSGRAVASCTVPCQTPGEAPITLADGTLAIRDTTLFQGRAGSLMTSFADEARRELYLSAVLGIDDVPNGTAAREGWAARGDDKIAVRNDVLSRFRRCNAGGVVEMLEGVDEWTLYPVYALTPNGRWSKGRVMIIGDAAHAMPPQGESTGVAIEDGVLLAHVLERHQSRTVPQLFADYEQLRRQTIEKLFARTAWGWKNSAAPEASWFWSVFIDYLTMAYLWFMKFRQEDYFAQDVAKFELPE